MKSPLKKELKVLDIVERLGDPSDDKSRLARLERSLGYIRQTHATVRPVI